MTTPHRACRLARVLLAGLLLSSGPLQSLAASALRDPSLQQDANSAPRKAAPRNDRAAGDASRPRLSTLEEQPIIRVALMTDVPSSSLSCPAGLVIRTAEGKKGLKVARGPIRIELRKQAAPEADADAATKPPSVDRPGDRPPIASKGSETIYRIWVGSSRDSERARKLTGELKKKFYEPASIVFDPTDKEYDVFIGPISKKSDADLLVARLKREGYAGPRIEANPNQDIQEDNSQSAPTTRDTTAKLAKLQSQSTPQKTTARPTSPLRDHQTRTVLAVVESGNVIASTSDTLAITPDRPSAMRSQNHEVITSGRGDAQTASGTAAFVRVGAKEYRGEIQLVLNPRGSINVINAVPIEEYLCGVVPMELSPTAYPAIEALKAQAVAARSYALASRGKHESEGYDVVDDARAQVYGGVAAERELSNRAIEQTQGIVAVYVDESGRATPIEALYTANCGGRTEDNEAVFGGEALPYLRGVACSLDPQQLGAHQIVTTRRAEQLAASDGRPLAREIALLEVLGFPIPRSVSGSWLRAALDEDELRRWIERAARLAGQDAPPVSRGDTLGLAQLARLVSSAVYGEDRASRLLSPADVDYLLTGFAGDQIPRELRADVAMLLKEGALVLPDGTIDARTPVNRSLALEVLARTLAQRSQASRPNALTLNADTLQAAQNARLVLVSLASTAKPGNNRESKYVAVNTSATNRGNSSNTKLSNGKAPDSKDVATQNEAPGVEVDGSAWLFRLIGGRSYPVERLALIGGERLTYHVNSAGRIDFLEAAASDRSASSDQYSATAQWRERVTVDEMKRRLARARINVGQPEKIEPLAFSSSQRATGVEVTGDRARATLRGRQICNALGLRENLFVVDRERDEQGHVTAFVFTGRGWGHGVGMCQTGAYGLAREGYAFTAILQKYYTGIKLQRMY